MKILLIGGFGYNLTSDVLTTRGTAGWVLYLMKLMPELVKLGHEVYQIVQCGKDAGLHDGVHWIEQNDHTSIKKITQEADIAINLCGWDWLYTDILPDKCKKIFWSHDYRNYETLDFWNNRSYGANPNYVQLRNKKEIRPNFIDQFDKIITNTFAHKESIEYTLKQPKGKTVFIYPGINHFDVPKVERDQFKLIYCANASKGLQHVPDIYKKLKKLDNRYNLTIVSNISLYGFKGTKPQHEEIKKELLKLPDVRILSELTRDELMKEVASSQVYLFPCSYKESFGFTILEAVKCGTFCVTSNIGSVREFKFDGLIKIDVNDIYNLPEYKYAKLNDQQLEEFVIKTHDICKNNLQTKGDGVDEFTWEKNALCWDKIIKEVYKNVL